MGKWGGYSLLGVPHRTNITFLLYFFFMSDALESNFVKSCVVKNCDGCKCKEKNWLDEG